MIADKVNIYNKLKGNRIKLKAVFFDMDGVLFDSMPYHAEAWIHAFSCAGISFTPHEVYLNEGRTGDATIDGVFQNAIHRSATPEEKMELYAIKSAKFDELNTITPIEGVFDLLKKIKSLGLQMYVVTGSGQKSLLENLDTHFPGIFDKDKIISASDVNMGKPHPEPYLRALERAKLQPFEAVVVENAPLGIESAVAAGIFTIAVNTGVLEDLVLDKAGANIIYPNMKELNRRWNELFECAK